MLKESMWILDQEHGLIIFKNSKSIIKSKYHYRVYRAKIKNKLYNFKRKIYAYVYIPVYI